MAREGRTINRRERGRGTCGNWGLYTTYSVVLPSSKDNGAAGFFCVCLEYVVNVSYCSPEDQATLEAEYKLNPKPNKAARAEIVGRVKLNEKEVQVSY